MEIISLRHLLFHLLLIVGSRFLSLPIYISIFLLIVSSSFILSPQSPSIVHYFIVYPQFRFLVKLRFIFRQVFHEKMPAFSLFHFNTTSLLILLFNFIIFDCVRPIPRASETFTLISLRGDFLSRCSRPGLACAHFPPFYSLLSLDPRSFSRFCLTIDANYFLLILENKQTKRFAMQRRQETLSRNAAYALASS